MFPSVNISKEAEKVHMSRTSFKFDFETGQHVIVDGNLLKCDYKESIKQFITTLLKTESGKYKVYTDDETDNFGISIYKYIGDRIINNGFIISELKREIEEQLLKHDFIESIKDFSTEFKGRSLIISFLVKLSDNSTINIMQEVVI